MKNVFISWSQETKPVAEAIGSWLDESNSGIKSWVSSVDLIAGQKWRAEIDSALADSSCAIACLGPSSIKSAWVLYETGAIGSRAPIIPFTLHIPPSKLPVTLTDFQVLRAFPSPVNSPDPQIPEQLARGISTITDTNFDHRTLNADEALLNAIRKFSVTRIDAIRNTLRSTKKMDTLIAMLTYIHSRKGQAPRNIIKDDAMVDLFEKKYAAGLALFWLREHGLLDITEFDDLNAGKVELSFEGQLLLTQSTF